MGFDFFKKLGGKGHKPRKDQFDSATENVGFDELEASGEFIDDGNYALPPPLPPAPPLPPPPPPPRPAPPRSSAAPVPPPSPAFDDLTVVNPGPPGAAPVPPRPSPTSPPVPPAAPARPPAPPARPAPPPRPAVAPRSAMPPPPVRDDVTMVLSGPVGAECLVAWLVVATGPNRGRDYRLPGGTVRLGLDPVCDVCLAGDTYVSSCHAEISFRHGQYEVRDLASTNGIYVNEARVDDAILQDNDRVRIGVTQLVFKSFSL